MAPAVGDFGRARPLRFVRLRSEGGEDTLDLASVRALVLVFDTQCRACNENFPRWLDLIVEARRHWPTLAVFGLSLDSERTQSLQYWRGLEHVVTVVKPVEGDDLGARLSAGRVPSTVIVRNGRPEVAHFGTIGSWRRSFLLRALGR